MSEHSAPRKRRRFAPLLLIAGVASAIVLSLSMTNTFSAFTATITNSNNTTATGTIILQEVNTATGGSTCTSTDITGTGNSGNSINNNSAGCATINKYGGSTTLVPSNSNTTPTNTSVVNLTFKNTGTATPASFTLAPGTCGQSANGTPTGSATDFCGKLKVVITSGATPIASGTATTLAGTTISFPTALVPGPGVTVPVTVTVYLDATAGNTYQGLAASQQLVWTLST